MNIYVTSVDCNSACFHTGHSYRETSATILANAPQVTDLDLLNHGDWNSFSSAKRYTKYSVGYKTYLADKINHVLDTADNGDEPSCSTRSSTSISNTSIPFDISNDEIFDFESEITPNPIDSNSKNVQLKIIDSNHQPLNDSNHQPLNDDSIFPLDKMFSFANCTNVRFENITINIIIRNDSLSYIFTSFCRGN